MWEYYLATSEISFRFLDNMNFQIQLAPDRNTLPLARDYMIEAERTHPGPRLVDRGPAERPPGTCEPVARRQRRRAACQG